MDSRAILEVIKAGRSLTLTIERVEERIIAVCLVGAAVTSIALNIVGIDTKWYIPGIFLALYVVLHILIDIRERQRRPGIESRFYSGNIAFYADAQSRMHAARSQVWVTYSRSAPPTDYSSAEAASYFRYTIEWAKQRPDCEFRRIVSAPDSGPMAAWLIKHHGETRDIGNYRIRVEPSSGRPDEIGLSIVDNEAVYLALSGDGTSMTGHKLETPEAVQAFREHYLQRWACGEAIEDYMRRVVASNP